MAYLLIRNIDPQLRRELEKRARANRRTLSEEAKALLCQALNDQVGQRKMGTVLANLLPPEYRSDEYVFEIRGEISRPPDFD